MSVIDVYNVEAVLWNIDINVNGVHITVALNTDTPDSAEIGLDGDFSLVATMAILEKIGCKVEDENLSDEAGRVIDEIKEFALKSITMTL